MIIYGTKATPIAAENINDKCASCGTENSVQMIVFQKYAHVFWIPWFPIGKMGVMHCSHCQQVLQRKEFSRHQGSVYGNLKSKSKTPIWTFFGLAVMAVLVAWASIRDAIRDGRKNERNTKLISAPKKGDIYNIRAGDRYTLYKVDSMAGDTVFVLYNQYETNKTDGLAELRDSAYIPLHKPIAKAALKNMLDKGDVMDIARK